MCCFLKPAPRFGGEQFKADIAASRTQQVGTGFMNPNSPRQIGFVAGSAALAQKSGYCYIYISNEMERSGIRPSHKKIINKALGKVL